jgi:3'-5' exoribonuclease
VRIVLSLHKEYKITSFVITKTKNDDEMAKLQLKDMQTNETFNCVIWQDFLVNIDKKSLRVGNIISVPESEYVEKFNNAKIKQIKLIKEASTGLSESERQIAFDKILEVINSFKYDQLKSAILQVIFENESLFKISPAARTHHHNYIGGLMQHILECIDFAKSLLPVIPVDINHELILAGCIAHDLGKMFEYTVDTESGVVGVDEKFIKEWISHIHWGFSWANQNGFPCLAHIIASHHGIKDYGALVEPATKEAELFHEIDMLSSRLGRLSVEELERV